MLHILSSAMHKESMPLPLQLDAQWQDAHQVIAVLTGGTEAAFLRLIRQGQLSLSEPIYMLVSGQSNSLAASLEILSWIQQHGGQGVLLREKDKDSYQSITPEQIPTLETSDQPAVSTKLNCRLGVVGFPSDWLIASQVDYERALQELGVELVDIPIEEVTSLGIVDGGQKGADLIYQRLREIVTKYDLQGVTLRCFDMLTTVHNTGCMALSRLNDEGIPAACEGDIPALLTMMLCHQRTGEYCFQVNPARIQEDGRMLWAHCTLPLKMCSSHVLTTHFESGIGVAIHGELPLGDYTLVKLSADLRRLLAEDVELVANQYEPNLCRTQVWIQGTPELAERLLREPIANHHILIRGHHAKDLR